MYVHMYIFQPYPILTLVPPLSSRFASLFPLKFWWQEDYVWSSLHTAIHMYELHVFCAACGHAPNILGFKSLSGGFFGIAMKLIESSWQILSSPFLAKHREWANQLNQLVQSFHAKGLVHRNFQNPNIICNKDRVMLLDFNRGGKEGEVSYPDIELNPNLTKRQERTDLKITKEDDIRILSKTLMNLQME